MCLDTKDNVFSPRESSDFLMLLFKCNNVLQAETSELFLLNLLLIFVQHLCEQECIPVGCVLSPAVAIGEGGVCPSACWVMSALGGGGVYPSAC